MLEGTLVRRAAGRLKRGAVHHLSSGRQELGQVRQRLQLRGRVYRALGRDLPQDYGRPFFPPASFDAWVARTGEGRPVLYPPAWRTYGRLVVEQPSRIAVLMHVHFPELVDELVDQLAHIPVPFDLIVTNSSGEDVDIRPVGAMRNCRVLPVDNHGRDIWPTVAAVNSGVLDPYLLVLKVHTKKSAWREEHELAGDGSTWRAGFLEQLLGNRTNVEVILDAFRSDPGLGVVTADGSVLGPEFWGDNQRNARELARRLEFWLDDDSLTFPAGSMYWCRGIVLQGLRALLMTEADFEEERGQVNGTTAHAVERLIGVLTTEAGLSTVERSLLPRPAVPGSHQDFDGRPLRARARFVPFYLPQFHPTPENDEWWGTGFTEWTNVTTTRPVFHGHYQPRLPTDLGFYDLRSDEVRRAQAQLASFAGIEGFMYYYYWFAGKRLLHRPIEALLASDLEFPFCLMWANENWTRRWDGNSQDILLAQDYDRVPAEQFIEDVADFLADPRYMTVEGKKILAVYRPAQMPDFARVARRWREIARQKGIGELFLLHVDVGHSMQGLDDAASHGLDGSMEFPPHNMLWKGIDRMDLHMRHDFHGNAMSYPALADDAAARAARDDNPNHFPGAMVTFDNTARRQLSSDFWFGANPYVFHRWLQALARAVTDRDPDRRLIFVNAWNEWAEAAVLEPTDRHGRSFLLALRDVAYS
ncbi:glycoside hydrolase family 99-like domain-containing protein [Blastococcus deserti]|uniref:Glycoside hydrolase family 99-like domain-containing protein n=1 Tax=Blastococcus deserti TaxID=2259033 RepID=A0ABW4X7D6_9ACTN